MLRSRDYLFSAPTPAPPLSIISAPTPAPAPAIILTLKASVVDPNTLNLDPDPGFWPNLDPDPDPELYYQF